MVVPAARLAVAVAVAAVRLAVAVAVTDKSSSSLSFARYDMLKESTSAPYPPL